MLLGNLEKLEKGFCMDFDLSKVPGHEKALSLIGGAMKGDCTSMSGLMDWAYNTASSIELPGLASASELAAEYAGMDASLEKRVDKLINTYCLKVGVIGAATSAGSLVTLPINLVSTTLLQLRMASAIAVMGGWKLEDERVRQALILCALGSETVSHISEIVIQKAIAVATAKLAGKSCSKLLPGVGILLGGAMDSAVTKCIGQAAKKCFITNIPEELESSRELACAAICVEE